MISLYFGLPGCGKTTMYTKLAVDADIVIEKDKKRVAKGKKPLCPYKHIYGNVPLFGLSNYTRIKFSYLGVYDIRDCLLGVGYDNAIRHTIHSCKQFCS